MTTDLETRITDLRNEAAAHGDIEMVQQCDLALDDDSAAISACVNLMNDVAAMMDD